MVAKTRSASQGGNRTPRNKLTKAIKKKAKSTSAQSPTLTQQFSMAEYCSSYGVRNNHKRNGEPLIPREDRTKVARTVQVVEQSVSGKGHKNITQSSSQKSKESDSESDSEDKNEGGNEGGIKDT